MFKFDCYLSISPRFKISSRVDLKVIWSFWLWITFRVALLEVIYCFLFSIFFLETNLNCFLSIRKPEKENISVFAFCKDIVWFLRHKLCLYFMIGQGIYIHIPKPVFILTKSKFYKTSYFLNLRPIILNIIYLGTSVRFYKMCRLRSYFQSS